MTESVHLPLLSALNSEVAWIIDANEQQAKKIAKAFKSTAFPCSTELSELSPPTVVLVTCPYGVRMPYFKALETAMPQAAIFVEKPVARTIDEHKYIESLRPASKVGAGYNRRASAHVRLAKRLIEDSFFGAVQSICFEYGGVGVTTGGSYRANLELAGGGPLLETGVHGIDSINYMLGAQDASVTDVHMEVEHGFDIHTDANFTVNCDAGSVPCHVKTTLLEQTRNCLTVTFSSCSVEFSLFGGNVVVRSRLSGRTAKISDVRDAFVGSVTPTCNYWVDFLEAVHSGQSNYTNMASSRVTTATIQEIYRQGLGVRH